MITPNTIKYCSYRELAEGIGPLTPSNRPSVYYFMETS